MLWRLWHRRTRCAPAALRRAPFQVTRLAVEFLEERALPSSAEPFHVVAAAKGGVGPLTSSGPVGYAPSQIRHAYGFDQISFTQNGTSIPGTAAG
jgi:hypothetical protein